jgi:pimeloyl-ACP methyl ester carboxylesterase
MPDLSSLYKSPAGYAAAMAWYDAELARQPVPVESRFVETRFGPTHLIIAGPVDAPPLVLVQGLGGNAMMWRPQLAAFARHHRVHALDVIGQTGRSAPAHPPHTGPAYAEWLVDVYDALEIERADILGLSMGGRLVLKFGAHAPERIRKAVLLSSIGFTMLGFGLFVHLLPVGFNLLTPSREVIGGLVRRILAPGCDAQDENLASLVEAFCLFVTHYRQETWRGLPLAFPLPRAELRRHTAPTLLLMGQHEVLFNPQAVIARARRVLPNLVAAEIVPHAGHLMHYEQPDAVNARVLEFLKRSNP